MVMAKVPQDEDYYDRSPAEELTPASELYMELLNRDPDEVVDLLQISTLELCTTFPTRVLMYLETQRDSDVEGFSADYHTFDDTPLDLDSINTDYEEYQDDSDDEDTSRY